MCHHYDREKGTHTHTQNTRSRILSKIPNCPTMNEKNNNKNLSSTWTEYGLMDYCNQNTCQIQKSQSHEHVFCNYSWSRPHQIYLEHGEYFNKQQMQKKNTIFLRRKCSQSNRNSLGRSCKQ